MFTPDEIARHALDVTGQALDEGHFLAFREFFSDRVTVATSLGERSDIGEEGLRETFGRVRWYYRTQRINKLARKVLYTFQSRADSFVSVHETRLLRNGAPVQKPFKVLSTFKREASAWRIVDSCYAIDDSLGHNRALLGPAARIPKGLLD